MGHKERNLRFSLVVSMDVAQRERELHHSLQKQILRPVSTCPGGQTLDSTIHWINCYPVDYENHLRYPLDRNLSTG